MATYEDNIAVGDARLSNGGFTVTVDLPEGIAVGSYVIPFQNGVRRPITEATVTTVNGSLRRVVWTIPATGAPFTVDDAIALDYVPATQTPAVGTWEDVIATNDPRVSPDGLTFTVDLPSGVLAGSMTPYHFGIRRPRSEVSLSPVNGSLRHVVWTMPAGGFVAGDPVALDYLSDTAVVPQPLLSRLNVVTQDPTDTRFPANAKAQALNDAVAEFGRRRKVQRTAAIAMPSSGQTVAAPTDAVGLVDAWGPGVDAVDMIDGTLWIYPVPTRTGSLTVVYQAAYDANSLPDWAVGTVIDAAAGRLYRWYAEFAAARKFDYREGDEQASLSQIFKQYTALADACDARFDRAVPWQEPYV